MKCGELYEDAVKKVDERNKEWIMDILGEKENEIRDAEAIVLKRKKELEKYKEMSIPELRNEIDRRKRGMAY